MPPFTNKAQTMRAVLLASATAATLGGLRAKIAATQAEALPPLRACRNTVVAPRMSRVRSVVSTVPEVSAIVGAQNSLAGKFGGRR